LNPFLNIEIIELQVFNILIAVVVVDKAEGKYLPHELTIMFTVYKIP